MFESSQRPKDRAGRVTWHCFRCASFALAILFSLADDIAFAQQKLSLKAPTGFDVSLFADDDLAHDIHCMTIDSRGRITVAGIGYIKILTDTDGDGIADRADMFSEGPKNGVQGMYWHGPDLLAVGGEGLTLYRDADRDGKADQATELLLKVKTGGEHHAHAIQQGPDGWWYLIAGNDSELGAKYVTLPGSPVKQPESGVLFRMKPDIQSGGEVVAHGLRNSYDFAFSRSGDPFTYDSDDERDVSLPWYRPTRVFQLLPGSHAGWVTRSWKRPEEFLDMPPVVAGAGRGSPTGVVCYRHRQFPEKYRDALFVLDWTFGRVLAMPLVRKGSTFQAEAESFLTASGDHGFAPTDAEVGPDGSLFVSVGGRGTRGGIWKITYSEGQSAAALQAISETASDEERLAECLNAPQPLSSWSRARWVPLAKQLGRERFVDAASNLTLRPDVRARAIEIVTERFGGLTESETATVAANAPAEIKAKAIWSLGRTRTNPLDADTVRPFVEEDDPLVARFALEALLSAEAISGWTPLVPGLAKQLSSNDRFVRLAASRLIARLDSEEVNQVSQLAAKSGWSATIANGVGLCGRSAAGRRVAMRIAVSAFDDKHSPAIQHDAARLMQLALGDVVPKVGAIPAFESFTPASNVSESGLDLAPLRSCLSNSFPTGDAATDRELSRVIAMLAPNDEKLLARVVAKLTDDSDPIEDIHYLLVAARITAPRTQEQSDLIARTLVQLESKLVARKFNQDLNWDDRVGELYRELRRRDDNLPERLVAQTGFGRPGHVLFLSQLPSDLMPRVVQSYVQAVQSQPDYSWTSEVVNLIGDTNRPEHLELVRQQFEQFKVRGAVLTVLARNPQERDRAKFVEGLEESRLEVLTACVDALSKLPAGTDSSEQFSLLRALRRLGVDPKEFPIREQVARILARNHGRDFQFVFGSAGHRPQPEAIERWTQFLGQKYPAEAARSLGGDAETVAWLKEQLTGVDWAAGDSTRGQVLFEKRACAQCHGGRKGLGPDLAGATSRFSRDDLFVAIALPNRDVSPRYQTTLVETKSGKVHTGLIVYESVEGVLLRNSMNQTLRIEAAEIETRRTLPQSLMPAGLLKEFRSTDYADLLAHLRTLGK